MDNWCVVPNIVLIATIKSCDNRVRIQHVERLINGGWNKAGKGECGGGWEKQALYGHYYKATCNNDKELFTNHSTNVRIFPSSFPLSLSL